MSLAPTHDPRSVASSPLALYYSWGSDIPHRSSNLINLVPDLKNLVYCTSHTTSDVEQLYSLPLVTFSFLVCLHVIVLP